MPFRTVLDLGLISIKSDLLFKMQLEAPVSMHIGFPPGEKFIILDEVATVDCQALR
jgi:hypothetical protein